MNKIIESTTKAITDHYDEFDLSYSSSNIADIVKISCNNKAMLGRLLKDSNIGEYEEDRQRIRFTIESPRKLNQAQVREKLKRVIRYSIPYSAMGEYEQYMISDICYYLSYHVECNSIPKVLAPYLVAMGFDKAREGMKLTKLLNKYGDGPVFTDYLNQLGEVLNTKTEVRTYYLSWNAYDFARMSEGVSWDSCHRVGGCYQAGALSLMTDEVTAILYEEGSDESKLVSRSVVHVHGSTISFPRVYGDNPDAFRVACEKISQSIGHYLELDMLDITECELYGRDYNAYNMAYTDGQYGMYKRYKFSDVPLKVTNDKIGGYAHCISCGEVLEDDENTLHCEDCDDRFFCEHCEEYHHGEPNPTYEGETICDDCASSYFTWSDYHDCYVRDHYAVWAKDVRSYVHSDEAYRCEECEDWFIDEFEVTYHDGQDLCEECIQEKYTTCANCGELVINGDVLTHEGAELCPDCYDSVSTDDPDEREREYEATR